MTNHTVITLTLPRWWAPLCALSSLLNCLVVLTHTWVVLAVSVPLFLVVSVVYLRHLLRVKRITREDQP